MAQQLSVFQYTQLLHRSFEANDQCSSAVDHKAVMDVCFELALFLTAPNAAIASHESKVYLDYLQPFIEENLAQIIVLFLVHRSDYLSWTPPEDDAKGRVLGRMVNYSCSHCIVDFGNARRDYVNVRTQILCKQQRSKYHLNIYCFDKGDELWLGLISAEHYSPFSDTRCDEYGLFYYGGREGDIEEFGGLATDKCSDSHRIADIDVIDCNHGAMQGKGDTIVHPLDSYSGGDWMNFEIDMQQRTMVCFKNGKQQARIEQEYFPHGDCYFVVTLDEKIDKFFIEQACSQTSVT